MKMRPQLLLLDGCTVSVQANAWVYCFPREDDAESYGSVEAWFFDPEGNELTDEPLAFLPAKDLMKMIKKHGGIVKGELPPLRLGDEEE